MNEINRSASFNKWLDRLKDKEARFRILGRIRSAVAGNFGDCKPVGDGIFEMRIHFGAGYRVYYTRTGSTIYLLLAGGTKSSQNKDIARAKKIAVLLKEI